MTRIKNIKTRLKTHLKTCCDKVYTYNMSYNIRYVSPVKCLIWENDKFQDILKYLYDEIKTFENNIIPRHYALNAQNIVALKSKIGYSACPFKKKYKTPILQYFIIVTKFQDILKIFIWCLRDTWKQYDTKAPKRT